MTHITVVAIDAEVVCDVIHTTPTHYVLWDVEMTWTVERQYVRGGKVSARYVFLAEN